MTPRTVVVSVSGGKDSTATALLAMHERAAVRFVFADTGHEHELTYDYVTTYLPTVLGAQIEIVRADFTDRIAGKRKFIAEKWLERGATQADVDRALAVLHPTGVPFLDLCLWKGLFPSRKAQFCTQELKRYPLDNFMLDLLGNGPVESWQGVRRDESANRKDVLERERTPEGWVIVRPIATWSVDVVIEFIRSRGVALNPLYKLGMGRVGCMPCINCGKDELAEIARRYPHHVDRVREWERIVSDASKRGFSSFFTDAAGEDETPADTFGRLNVDQRIKWAMTSRGGRQFNILKTLPPAECSSVYGLCE